MDTYIVLRADNLSGAPIQAIGNINSLITVADYTMEFHKASSSLQIVFRHTKSRRQMILCTRSMTFD